LAWSGVVASAAGCGGDGRLKLYQVSGVVTVKGKPAAGAEVILYPIDESMRGVGKPLPTGVAGSDGRFTLTSYEPNDGAPAGEYEVGVVWPEPAKPTTPDNPEIPPVVDRLKNRYAVPAKSGLKTTVEPGATELAPIVIP